MVALVMLYIMLWGIAYLFAMDRKNYWMILPLFLSGVLGVIMNRLDHKTWIDILAWLPTACLFGMIICLIKKTR